MTRRILTNLINEMVEHFELHAYGRLEIEAAEKISEKLNRWIEVDDIETGEKFGDKYMVITFRGTKRAFNAYKKAKETAKAWGDHS